MAHALLLGLLLQCVDPPTPPGPGFPFTIVPPQVVTLSDGYQTLVEMRHPAVPPGPCGWPVVLLVHWYGADLANVSAPATTFAQQGYLSVSFEVRGQGLANVFNLNPGNGTRYYWLRERIDMKEVLDWVGTNYASLGDLSRLGVTGVSQGGVYSWIAAAWSGLPFEPNPWNAGSFPVVSAVVAEDVTPDLGEHASGGGPGVFTFYAQMTTGSIPYAPSVEVFPPVEAQLLSAIQNEDGVAWNAFWEDPLRNPESKVPQITTAVMAQIAFDDYHYPSDSLARAFSQLPAATPKKLYLGAAGAHKAPANEAEVAFRKVWRKQWFDRHLKGIANGIDATPPIEYTVIPNTVAEYFNLLNTWEHRQVASWPPPGVVAYSLYPRAGGALSLVAPAGPESDDPVVQTVAPGYDMVAMIADSFGLPDIAANIPLSIQAYDTAPLAAPLEVVGSATVHLEVTSPGTRYQARAAVYDVDLSGAERYLCGGSGFVRDNAPAGPNALDIELNATAYVVEAGHTIRLKVMNLQLHQPPVGTDLRFLPYSDPFSFDVRHSAGAATRLDLPVRPVFTVSAAPPDVSVSLGGASSIGLSGGEFGAGQPYVVVISLSGSSPGVPFGTGVVPINPDAFTTFALVNANSFLYPNFVSTLSPTGTATASLVIPAGLATALAGATVTVAAVVLNPLGYVPSANAASVLLVP